MQEEVLAAQSAADAAAHSLSQAKAALAVQRQDSQRAAQISASLKVRDPASIFKHLAEMDVCQLSLSSILFCTGACRCLIHDTHE